ncbi:MAG TPA: hypothetical protein VFC57_05010 [Aeromicrobium sp.]|nr:hypothetical protein [Aeromicrobium sp.]
MNSSLPGTYVGHLIIASFGLVFVGVNSGSLNYAWRFTAIALAAAAVLAVAAAFGRTLRNWNDVSPEIKLTRFNKPFLIIVAIEVVALFGGARIIGSVEPSAILGWVALVVGLHLIALAIWWMPGQIGFLFTGVALTLLGIAGLVIGFLTQETDTVALLSGVGSGIVLLGTSLIAAVRTLTYRQHPTDAPVTPR